MQSGTRSYAHTGGSVGLLGSTIDEHFQQMVRRFGSREAVVSMPQRRRLTYAQLDAQVQHVARALLGIGMARGSRVGIWATDNLEWVVLQLATARIGAILVNINPAYRIAELRHAMRLAQIECVVLMPSFRSSRYVEMLGELVPEAQGCEPMDLRCHLLPHLRRVVVYDPLDLDRRARWVRGFMTWAEFLEAGLQVSDDTVAARAEKIDVDDPVNIQFTSGTTGFPKAVVLTHHNILNNAYFTGIAMSLTERDRLCVPLPFYHCFGMVVSNLACLSHGACIVIASDHFEAGATLRAIQDEKCTAVHGVPTMFLAELEHPDFGSFDLSSLRTGIMAGAPCPPELMRRVMNEMGCREIIIGYGQTECSPIATLTDPRDTLEHRTQSVGKPIAHQECKIVDPQTGRIQPRGVPGEVCFRGYHVMRGYYAQPEETARVIDSARWLHSGDLGVMDEDGYIRITGRLKDMIIRGGENIYPAEIEAFYYEHPDVEEIAVFGVPDEKMGEEVGAWVRLRPGACVSAEELQAWARGRIAHYKVPRLIWFVDMFPMTVTGKIQKSRIRAAVQRWREAGAEKTGKPVTCFVD
ncbi:MAG: AMP-binding protein [Phycisphaerales bacterium]